MSKARRKGTGYENHLRDVYLRHVWPTADRAPLRGVHDRGDFDHCADYVVEAKKRDRWDLPSWIRTTADKVTGPHADRWMVWFAGNKTKSGLTDDYVVMPASLATMLLQCETALLQIEEDNE